MTTANPNPNFANSKRVAKNTLLLYIRMIAVTLVSLVTVKYTLRLLGEDDYGVYNVVGGVVAFMTVITTSVTLATNRFLAFELGQRNAKKYNDIFCMLLMIFAIVATLICVLLESLSYPIIYHWLQIPANRLDAAFSVFHFSTLAFVVNVLGIPFMSSILANEKMGVYAYVTIIETMARLAILGVLFFSKNDRLVTYSVCTLLVTVATSCVYFIYNQRYIANTRIYVYWDKALLRQLSGYTGWSLFGSVTMVMCTHGLSILMNLFFGVAVNAAKAISDRIKNILQSFVLNFYVAVSPQITKTYSAGDLDATIRLAYSSTRLAFYLMMIVSLPAIILMDNLLHLWLGDDATPDMVVFTQLSLVFAIVNVFEAPVTFMVRATGDIKRYQVSVGVFTLMIVPLSYLLFLLECPAYSAFLVEIVIYVFVQIIRVRIAKRYFEITFRGYLSEVIALPAYITGMVIAIIYITLYLTGNIWLTACFATCVLIIAVWMWGMKSNEKILVKNFIRNKLYNHRRA